jgi:hypothetical protein
VCSISELKADFQSSQLAAIDAWALSSNHNAKPLILIRCMHSQRAARSFVRGLEIRLKSSTFDANVFYDHDILFSVFCRFDVMYACEYNVFLCYFECISTPGRLKS